MTYRPPPHRREALAEALAALRGSRASVLTTHVNADGDGVGSELALARWLRAHGNRCVIVNPTRFPSAFEFLLEPDAHDWVLPAGGDAAINACREADLAVVLDTGEVPRIGRVRPMIQGRRTVVIDHHPPGDQAIPGISFRDSGASATGELVFELIQATDGPWSPQLIDALYVAILTDTGSFRFSNATPNSHIVTAELIERGADPERLHRLVYGASPLRRFQLLRAALATLEASDGVSWMTIPQDAYERLEATQDDLEGMVDVPRQVEGVEVGLLFRRTANGTKISFRSNGDVDVNELARQFDGGGHVRASGAHVERPLEEVIDEVVRATQEAVAEMRAGA